MDTWIDFILITLALLAGANIERRWPSRRRGGQ
jgi:hypothetical protein